MLVTPQRPVDPRAHSSEVARLRTSAATGPPAASRHSRWGDRADTFTGLGLARHRGRWQHLGVDLMACPSCDKCPWHWLGHVPTQSLTGALGWPMIVRVV